MYISGSFYLKCRLGHPESYYFLYLQKSFPDQSIQLGLYLLSKIEALLYIEIYSRSLAIKCSSADIIHCCTGSY